MKQSFFIFLFFLVSFSSFTQPGKSEIDSLEQVLIKLKDDTARVDTLNDYSWKLINKGQYESARDYAEQAIILATHLKFKRGMGTALNNMGLVYDYQGNYPQALEYYLAALKIREETGNKRGTAICLNNIGIIHHIQKNYSEALEYYFKSLKICKEITDKNGIARAYNNIGHIYQNQKNYGQALSYYFKALKMKEEIGDKKGISISLHQIGSMYRDQQNKDRALEYYLKAMKISEEIDDKKDIASTLNNLGQIYLAQKKMQDALVFCEKSLILAKEIGSLEDIQAAEKSLSEIYEQTGPATKALEHYKRHIEIRDSIYNEENTRKLVQSEMNFKFDKKVAIEKAEFEKKEALHKEEAKKQQLIIYFVSGILILALAFTFYVYRSYNQKQKINHELYEKNKKITLSINYARRIQQSILLEESEIQKYLPDSFIYFKPKDIVSGDFYWFARTKEKIVTAAIDCTGHGVPGAFMSLIGNSLMNELVLQNGITKPAEILEQLQQGVSRTLQQRTKDVYSDDGMDLALCTIDLKRREIQYAGARNPLYVIRNNTLQIIKGDIFSIGEQFLKKENHHQFINHTISVTEPLSLYMFTDGYVDQFGGKNYKKFGNQRFVDLLLASQHLPMQQQKLAIRSSHKEWKGNNNQTDDIMVLGIRL